MQIHMVLFLSCMQIVSARLLGCGVGRLRAHIYGLRSLFYVSMVFLTFLSAAITMPVADSQSTGDYLLMIDSPHCPWCEAFDDEIGMIYSQTEEGRLFPLKKIDFYAQIPAIYDIAHQPTLTPTFIVIDDFKEIGRIKGYPGEELFWWRLSEFVRP